MRGSDYLTRISLTGENSETYTEKGIMILTCVSQPDLCMKRWAFALESSLMQFSRRVIRAYPAILGSITYHTSPYHFIRCRLEQN